MLLQIQLHIFANLNVLLLIRITHIIIDIKSEFDCY